MIFCESKYHRVFDGSSNSGAELRRLHKKRKKIENLFKFDMNTREYRNYKRMTKMTVRFLENHDNKTILNGRLTSAAAENIASKAPTRVTFEPDITPPYRVKPQEIKENSPPNVTIPVKKEVTPITETFISKQEELTNYKEQKPEHGQYTNWNSQHTTLTTQPWCCIGDLMAFCDKYEYRTLNRNDPQTHNRIVSEVKTLLNGQAPFDIRKRFPGDIRSTENLWVCIGRCAGVEYHLNRILSVFRRPIDKLSAEKQRMVRHDFHLAINELRLDISARISEVRLYDRNVFEREFRLEWQDEPKTE